MRQSLWILAAGGLVLSGCGLFSDVRGPDSRVGRRMRLADSLEQEGMFQAAARQYAGVAEQFPQSDYYPTAVRRAALMYSISPYSTGNDSAAYRWFLAYRALPLSRAERENVRVSTELLHRILMLQAQIVQIYTATDSLSVLTKKQSASMTAESHRMQELESELQNAQAELKKIKEMDLRLSKVRNR
jgi:hypothetical protein